MVLHSVFGRPAQIQARMIVKASETWRPRLALTSRTGYLRNSRVAGISQVGSRVIVMVRRVISLTGSTLLPLDKNNVRVPTSAVLLFPRMRPEINSLVNTVHSDLWGMRSVVRLSNSTTAGAVNNSTNNIFRHSSSSAGKAWGVPR